jgi:membrane protease YdiL (CAAX protease family)
MTVITTPTQPAAAWSLKQRISRHPLVAYFTLAFAGFWIIQLPMLLSQDGLGLLPYTVPMLPFMLLFLLSTYAGPLLAAFVVTATERGRAGVRDFLRRCVRWRVGFRWWFLVLLGYPLLYVLAATVFMGAAPLEAVVAKWSLFFTSYLPTLVVYQGLTQWAEEPGWRGFALPRLEARFGPVPGSLLLGLLHGLWHLPVFTYTGGPVPLGPFDLATFALNTVLIAMMTITWSWVYNNTGSILLAVLLHSSFNASGSFIGEIIPAYPHEATILVSGAFVVISLLLVIATRGQLSYRVDDARRRE